MQTEPRHLVCRPIPGERAAEPESQRRLVHTMLASLTSGRLLLCHSLSDLPVTSAAVEAPVALTSTAALRSVRDAARSAAAAADLSEEKTMGLVLAVGEAAMNALVHGDGGSVSVYADPTEGVVDVWICDCGAGIALNLLPRVTLLRGYTTRSSLGYGFDLMLQSADQIWLHTGGQGTTIVIRQRR
jgi:anti-sigma regulatory factor (Ser/Thr protein kinase)